MNEAELKAFIRDIPDFPKPGILFRDVTPLLAHHVAFRSAVDQIVARFQGRGVTRVAGIEARGFIVAAPLATQLGAGFVPVRKPGKLPAAVSHQEYRLEHGTDSLEVHTDAIGPADRVLVVDDVLATGGTAAAAIELVQSLGARIAGLAVLVELESLGARNRLDGIDTFSLLRYGAD